MLIEQIIEKATGHPVDKEKFNKEILLLAEKEGLEVIYSDDGLVMFNHPEKGTQIAIPSSFVSIEKVRDEDQIRRDQREALLLVMLKETAEDLQIHEQDFYEERKQISQS